MGSRDNLVRPKWAEEAIGRMRLAYRALRADDHLLIDRFEGGHQWHGDVAYEVIDRVFG
jgi:hypothetical protein